MTEATESAIVWPPQPRPLPHHWSLDEVPYAQVQVGRVRDNGLLFPLIVSASLIESMTFVYAENLSRHFQDYPEAAEWVRERWQWEEIQHGHALRRYAEAVWPELDWKAAYRKFYPEYAGVSTMEALEPRRGLEMLSRVVVEVGTSTFYTMLGGLSDEPVLQRLAAYIAQDEVRHYTHFHRYFREYDRRERFGRGARAWAILRRLQVIENEDTEMVLKAIPDALPPDHRFRAAHPADIVKATRRAGIKAYPYRMAVTMLLKPLALPQAVKRLVVPLIERGARALLFTGP